MKTVAIYARYSTDLQNERSIKDQISVCQDRVQREGWKVFDCYSDYALSGANMRRPGIQQMLQDARAGNFNVVLVEALDRLSRDQADIANMYKRLNFRGVEIVTLSEGQVDIRDIALLGMMNQHYRVENANKIRRGLIGRIREGKAVGNIAYGYKAVKRLDTNGEPVRGERRIDKREAGIIRQIFRQYAEGLSPTRIARKLNARCVAGPTGRGWNPSSISGDRSRKIGILNNELYSGVRVWNRVTIADDPDTGKKVSRFNPPELWITKQVPELRIVDQRLWERVKKRQLEVRRPESVTGVNSERIVASPLLSGIVRCGLCGGRWNIRRFGRSGCAKHNILGTCKNDLRIGRSALEARVLDVLKERLGNDPLLCVALCARYARRLIELDERREDKVDVLCDELKRVELQREQMLRTKTGRRGRPRATAELRELKRRHQLLTLEIARAKVSLPDPAVMKTYREHVGELVQTFSRNIQRPETEALRWLIGSVIVRPNKDRSGLIVEVEPARPPSIPVNAASPSSDRAWGDIGKSLLT